MKQKKFDAVQCMRQVRKRLAQKLGRLSEKEQLEFLRKKYGYLIELKPVCVGT
ncbi:MAG: hypothetical protein HY762_06485 [Planctomycetes bacterium]|nr:hypothetical protein [Planctomycetota bacterium]